MGLESIGGILLGGKEFGRGDEWTGWPKPGWRRTLGVRSKPGGMKGGAQA